MFGDYFYHRQLRKYIALFGSVFKNIVFKRYNDDFSAEIERMKVDIVWGPKEKYMMRGAQDSLNPAVQMTLPRMAYELSGMSYDAPRKQNNLLRYATLNPTTNQRVYAAYMAAPYKLEFTLTVKARAVEDCAQIVEQILPYFQPDFTPTAQLLDNLQIPKDVRITLMRVDPKFDYEGDPGDSTREIEWALTFLMEVYFFGPVKDTPIITRVISNVYIERADSSTILHLGSGNGNFALDDTVYQGHDRNFATVSAHVINFFNSANVRQLEVNDIQGQFTLNTVLKSVTTNANYVLSSVDPAEVPIVTFIVEPNPLTANANSDFGITVTKNEF